MELVDSFTNHLELVQLVLKGLHPRRAFAFALACVERQWPVYEQSSRDKPWSPSGLRSSIDQAWQLLIDKDIMPGYLVDRCRRSCPLEDQLVDPEARAAHLISHAAIDLLSALQGQESCYCHLAAERNLSLLVMLAHEFDDQEFSSETESLIHREIKKQKDDLVSMRISASPERIAALRKASSGISLFGEVWFPE